MYLWCSEQSQIYLLTEGELKAEVFCLLLKGRNSECILIKWERTSHENFSSIYFENLKFNFSNKFPRSAQVLKTRKETKAKQHFKVFRAELRMLKETVKMGMQWFEGWVLLLGISHSCHCISLNSNEIVTQKLHMCKNLLWFLWGQLLLSSLLCGRPAFNVMGWFNMNCS